MKTKFYGYRRDNGRVGIRNYVLLIPVDDLSNSAVLKVQSVIQGTLAIPHPYGRLQFGEDLELHFRTLIGNGANPNVAAAIVIGIEPNWAKKIADGIAKTGKPVAYFGIEGQGELKTVEKASRKAQEFVQYATSLQKVEADLSELTVSFKCGESDTTSGLAGNPTAGVVGDRLVKMGGTVIFGETSEITGAEHILAKHFATKELGEKFLQVHANYLKMIEQSGADLLGSQPTQGNIAGGLTTIEEKALGNIPKAGTSPIQSVLDLACAPEGPGLHYMDSSSAAGEFITLMGAAGAVLHLFITGQGNICGNAIVPVVKISANPNTVKNMAEHIDVDISGVLTRELNLETAADKVLARMIETAGGRYTDTEALGHQEFILTRLYASA
ncbi:D-galactarate dehydratase / Altronate hydrolase, C terminus [Acididesulfobacillus acetoxydans]|uniref:(2R)-sulfolactate sulfo-lyase subunit beta n=1 Tax=Acididesulfobacillus acetoxydans TaxID=1561005 RepID=A0A8S0WR55_9FIRM|nr:UxaA family hydrolase [Acididesulfobacillus acetoxydans]CAA7603084.1 D-galactarate dehydratase / Altronate hydrolase, C terminus [Acididesulfobacillus acetoxydans]CEJ05678.1 (2R)-sulfolactate sulfo-lyase subunit beta [Acididesulfobacillus acetoxydans]